MIGDSPMNFIEGLSHGMEQVFVYRGRTMCAQGWAVEDDLIMLKLEQWEPLIDDYLLWTHKAPTVQECLDDFLEAPLFDGRTFWEAEDEMELLYS